jgi:aminoglycoside/choline kinase family phosphotransferase/molybdopterin-guanine dinucleotide biosynthesis protein A
MTPISPDERRGLKLEYFLARHGWADAERANLAGDASFRRYFRLAHEDDRRVLMDAPPPFEDVRPFVAITGILKASGLTAPTIMGADLEAGFLLLEDLGDDRFSRVLTRNPDRDVPLYEAAVDCLLDLHAANPASSVDLGKDRYQVPPYDMDVLLREVALFVDWYLPALRREPLFGEERLSFMMLWRQALQTVEGARDALVLRDYHADNLMWLPDRQGSARVGLLDYQDALMGHPAYDLVSLLEDARCDVPPALAEAMVDRYLRARPDLDAEDFRAAYALLGAQRNAKIIGIFTRLYARDGKAAYLDLLPRVWGLLERDLAHPALADLRDRFDRAVPGPVRQSALLPERIWRLPRTAMVLSAGLGTRMRPLTNETPKPLLSVGGAAMLDHSLNRLAEAGVMETVVNIHHLPEKMRNYLATRSGRLPLVRITDESDQLLDSGGGVRKALPELGDGAFFVLNGDTVWDNGEATDCLLRLAASWDPARMDALLLLLPTGAGIGHDGAGDFFMDEDGRLRRRGGADRAPYTFIGIQILSPSALADTPDGPFSLNLVYDRALEAGRLFGLVHEGRWFHVGTPDALAETDAILSGEMKS